MKHLSLLFLTAAFFLHVKSQVTGEYRSVVSGDWYNLAVWERFDGSAWQPATVEPASTDGTITIRNAHAVSATTAVTADQLIVAVGGTLTISNTVTIADGPGDDLTSNGTLVVNSLLTGAGVTLINGNLNWTLGTLNSPVTISSTGTLTLSTGATKALSNVLTNNGVMNWSAGNINFSTGELNNNGTLNISFDGTFSNFGGTNAFNNSGTVNKSVSTGVTSLDIPSTISGTLNVVSGTITTTVILNLNTGTSLNGNGGLLLNGTVNINVAVSAPGTLLIIKSSGVTAGTGTFTVNGNMNWTGGTLGSPFTIASGGVLTAAGSTKTLGGTLVINGAMNWTAGAVNFTSGSMANNGTLNNSFNGSLANTSGTNSFSNTGTFSKTGGTGITTIVVPAINSGTINVNAGTLFKNGTAITNTGTINIAASCTFTSNVALNLNAGSVINGSGILTLDGTVNINAALSLPSTITINKPNGSSTAGSALFTVNGTMNWLGGTIGSPFTVAAGATLNASSATKAINSTLINSGTLNWSAGTVNFNNGTLTNNGTIDNSFDGLFSVFSGTNLFANNGTFIKTGTTGNTTIAIPATNAGNLKGQGQITFNSSFSNTGAISPGASIGTLTISTASAAVLSATSFLNIEMLNASGAGTGNDLFSSTGNLQLNGTLDVTEIGTVPAGTYTIVNLTAGTITGNFASVNLPAGYVLNVGSSTITLTQSIVLPVTLINFNGRMIEGKIDLVWQTASEENFNRFEIERSREGSVYHTIGSVKRQNNGSLKTYRFSDLMPVAIQYYRLKMIDEDGKYAYSKVIEIKGQTLDGAFKIYPNPSSETFMVTLSHQWLNANITVRNTAGQLVLKQFAGGQRVSLKLGAQPDGIYWLMITKNNQSVIHALVKKAR